MAAADDTCPEGALIECPANSPLTQANIDAQDGVNDYQTRVQMVGTGAANSVFQAGVGTQVEPSKPGHLGAVRDLLGPMATIDVQVTTGGQPDLLIAMCSLEASGFGLVTRGAGCPEGS